MKDLRVCFCEVRKVYKKIQLGERVIFSIFASKQMLYGLLLKLYIPKSCLLSQYLDFMLEIEVQLL